MAGLMSERILIRDTHVGKRGQIVIPKDIRGMFGIKPGDSLVLFADKAKGIGIMKQDQLKEIADMLADRAGISGGRKKGGK